MDRTGDTLVHCYNAVTDLLQALYISRGFLCLRTPLCRQNSMTDLRFDWWCEQKELISQKSYKSKLIRQNFRKIVSSEHNVGVYIQRSRGSNPRSLACTSRTLPLSHDAPHCTGLAHFCAFQEAKSAFLKEFFPYCIVSDAKDYLVFDYLMFKVARHNAYFDRTLFCKLD